MVIKWRYLPNLISLFRLMCAVPVLYCLIHRDYGGALVFFFISAISDAADGYLARRFGWMSPFGAMLDPMADKILLVFPLLVLTAQGVIPSVFFWAVLVRELVIIGGAFIYRFWIGPYEFHPRFLSKLNTVAQLAFVSAVLASLNPWVGLHVLKEPILHALMAVALATTMVSGVDYVVCWGKKAWKNKK